MDVFASLPHLVDHLAPIWLALPETARGRFVVTRQHLAAQCAQVGITAEVGALCSPGGLTLVANHNDYTQVRSWRPVAYLEHGAGQTYEGLRDHPSYSGGRDRDAVVLFLTLNEATAARERARYPDARVVVVGAPKLDRWWVGSGSRPAPASDRPSLRAPVVAFAWHWSWCGVPEGGTAWPEYRQAMRAMHDAGWSVLGHGHPRMMNELAQAYERWGIPYTRSWDDVLATAHVVVFDNSSVGYEAAALGIPTVAVNASWYRRDVHHGLRFWDQVPGLQVDHPDDLARTVQRAIVARYDAAEQRRVAAISARVYPIHTRGSAARLAADALLRWEDASR